MSTNLSHPQSTGEQNRTEVSNKQTISAEQTFASSSSPLARAFTNEPLVDKPSPIVSTKVEIDKAFSTPSEYIDWDLMLTPSSPRPAESDPQTIPVFRQSRVGAMSNITVPNYGGDHTFASKLIRYHCRGPYHPICSAESNLFEPLDNTTRPLPATLQRGKTEGLLRCREDASPLGGVRAPADSPFAYFDANLVSPTFRDLTIGTDAWKGRGKNHSRQASSSLSGPQLATGLGPLCFASPCSPLQITERTSGSLQYSWEDYQPIQRSQTPLPSFGSPTHASVTCSTLCTVNPRHGPFSSPCIPPALAKDSTFAPPYSHWDDIGYLSLGDRHGGDYLQRLEALMSSPMGAGGGSEYAPLTSPTSDSFLPQVYHSAYSNPMFLLSGAEFLLAPKEAPLAPLQLPLMVVNMDGASASQTSSAALSNMTQPATITLDLTCYGSSQEHREERAMTKQREKVPIVVSRDYLSNESVEGGHTDASSQRSASTPSSTSGAPAAPLDSYQAYI